MTLPLLIVLLSFNVSLAQQYILFEKFKGVNKTQLGPDLYLFQNNIELQNRDTTLSIFNLYFSIDTLKTYGLQLKLLGEAQKDINKLENDILVTLIPLTKPGEKLRFKKLSRNDIRSLSILSNQDLLSKAVNALSLKLNNNRLSALRSLDYNLIIKEGNDYYSIEQTVYLEFNIIYIARSFLPNEYKDGVLNIAKPPYNKTYTWSDIEKFGPLSYQHVWEQLGNRNYISSIDESYSRKPIFHFWKLTRNSSNLVDINRKIVYPGFEGLNNFYFLEKVGIINCNVDVFYSVRKKESHGEPMKMDIAFINSLPPIAFQVAIAKYFKPKGITIIEEDTSY